VLTGDANGDAVTNDIDLFLVFRNLLRPPASRDLNQDLNGDSQVTSADVDIVKSNYLGTLPAAPAPFEPFSLTDAPAAASDSAPNSDAALIPTDTTATAPASTTSIQSGSVTAAGDVREDRFADRSPLRDRTVENNWNVRPQRFVTSDSLLASADSSDVNEYRTLLSVVDESTVLKHRSTYARRWYQVSSARWDTKGHR
jgi:hypothetical protein